LASAVRQVALFTPEVAGLEKKEALFENFVAVFEKKAPRFLKNEAPF